MTNNRMLIPAVFVLVAGTLLTVLARPAAAARGYTVRSLDGTYVGGLVEVRLPSLATDPLEYCDMAGTIVFDGAGNGTSDITRRCSLSGEVTDGLSLTYSVSPDGTADLLFSSGTAGRFKLAQGGQIAFITSVGSSDSTVLVQNGVFARQ